MFQGSWFLANLSQPNANRQMNSQLQKVRFENSKLPILKLNFLLGFRSLYGLCRIKRKKPRKNRKKSVWYMPKLITRKKTSIIIHNFSLDSLNQYVNNSTASQLRYKNYKEQGWTNRRKRIILSRHLFFFNYFLEVLQLWPDTVSQ